jgi:hypothetical protein
MATYGLSWPAQGTDQDQVQDQAITSFGSTEIFLHSTIELALVRPRNWSRHVKDLVINPFGPTVTFFTSQHVNSPGPPKDMTEATSKIHFSLANWLPLTFTYFQYNSIYWFTTGIRASLLKGPWCPYFTGCPPKGIPKVVNLDEEMPRSGTRRCKEHKI